MKYENSREGRQELVKDLSAIIEKINPKLRITYCENDIVAVFKDTEEPLAQISVAGDSVATALYDIINHGLYDVLI